jgi:hypothetical protein
MAQRSFLQGAAQVTCTASAVPQCREKGGTEVPPAMEWREGSPRERDMGGWAEEKAGHISEPSV